MIDVFTLGETMIRFTPKGFTRLEEAAEMELRIGGSESNLAIALKRIGLQTAWSSRLPDNALGHLVERRVRSFGVDVSGIAWAGDDRMGLYFIEPGAPPRSGSVLYDRALSAASRMAPEDFDWTVLDNVRHVHLTGITPALGDSPAATIARAMRETRSRGKTLSFDINYRTRLWSATDARKALEPLIQDVDLLISPEADVRSVFGGEGGPEDLAQHLGKVSRASWIALTLGGDGALLWNRDTFYKVEPFPVTPIDRVGAGDAFDAGLLWGFLQGDAPKGLQYGMAMAALKHTIPGDEFISSLGEVEALLQAGHRDIQR